jgi:hypothetical protein
MRVRLSPIELYYLDHEAVLFGEFLLNLLKELQSNQTFDFYVVVLGPI